MSSLAAARADGYYNPPDWDPRKGGLNKVVKNPKYLFYLYN